MALARHSDSTHDLECGRWEVGRRRTGQAARESRGAGGRLNDIVAFLEANKFQGLTIDFEEVPAKSQKNLQAFLSEMSDAFAEHGLAIVLVMPFDDDSWPYAAYAKIADYIVLMGYDQHWDESRSGSIAGQSWFEDTLDKRMKELDPDHTIVAIGGYGYDWIKGQPTQELTFEEAVLSARDSEADIQFDLRCLASPLMVSYYVFSSFRFGIAAHHSPPMRDVRRSGDFVSDPPEIDNQGRDRAVARLRLRP